MLAWIKKWGWAVLLGIAGILAAILGIKYERDKIASLKRKQELASLQVELAEDHAQIEVAKKKEEELAKKDEEVVVKVEKLDQEVEEAREEAERMKPHEVASAFNDRYRGRRNRT